MQSDVVHYSYSIYVKLLNSTTPHHHHHVSPSSLTQDLVGQRYSSTSVIRLDSNLSDLAVLDNHGIALGTVVAKDGLAVEGKVQRLGEGTRGVGEEANLFTVCVRVGRKVMTRMGGTGKRTYTRLAGGVEVLLPCLHAVVVVSLSL